MIPGRHYEPETIWFSNTSYYCIYRDGWAIFRVRSTSRVWSRADRLIFAFRATIVNDGDHFVSDYHANWTLNDCWKHCGHFDGKACHGEVQDWFHHCNPSKRLNWIWTGQHWNHLSTRIYSFCHWFYLLEPFSYHLLSRRFMTRHFSQQKFVAYISDNMTSNVPPFRFVKLFPTLQCCLLLLQWPRLIIQWIWKRQNWLFLMRLLQQELKEDGLGILLFIFQSINYLKLLGIKMYPSYSLFHLLIKILSGKYFLQSRLLCCFQFWFSWIIKSLQLLSIVEKINSKRDMVIIWIFW